MFNHVGLLTLVPEATDTQVQGIADALLALRGRIPGLEGAEVVRDAGLTEGNATLRFHMRFASQDDWRAYGQHPDHVAVVQTHLLPVLAGKAFVQYDDAEARVG